MIATLKNTLDSWYRIIYLGEFKAKKVQQSGMISLSLAPLTQPGRIY